MLRSGGGQGWQVLGLARGACAHSHPQHTPLSLLIGGHADCPGSGLNAPQNSQAWSQGPCRRSHKWAQSSVPHLHPGAMCRDTLGQPGPSPDPWNQNFWRGDAGASVILNKTQGILMCLRGSEPPALPNEHFLVNLKESFARHSSALSDLPGLS